MDPGRPGVNNIHHKFPTTTATLLTLGNL